MRQTMYYIFVPTDELAMAAAAADENWLVENHVWADVEYDRTGTEHAVTDVEQAFWTVFLAKLVSEEPESPAASAFRVRCLALGFKGCWRVLTTRSGGPVADLMSEAIEAGPYARVALGNR